MQKQLRKYVDSIIAVNICKGELEGCRIFRNIKGIMDKILTKRLSYAPEYSNVFVIIWITWMCLFTFILVGGCFSNQFNVEYIPKYSVSHLLL